MERPNNTLTFGQAIEGLKEGKRAFRAGWNGKGMFIYINYGSFDSENRKEEPASDVNKVEGIGIHLFKKGDVGTTTRLPNINIQSATGSTVTGWLASQTDILAEDWNLVE